MIGFHCGHSSLRSHHKMPTHNIIIGLAHFLENLHGSKKCSINSCVYYVNTHDSSVFRMSGVNLFLTSEKMFHLMEILKDTSSFTYVPVPVFQLYLASCKAAWVFPFPSPCLSKYCLKKSQSPEKRFRRRSFNVGQKTQNEFPLWQ